MEKKNRLSKLIALVLVLCMLLSFCAVLSSCGKDKDDKDIDYFAEQKEAIIYQLKQDEFNKDVQAKVDTFEVTVNKNVVKKCDPYEFRSMMAE